MKIGGLYKKTMVTGSIVEYIYVFIIKKVEHRCYSQK